jgi:hypothetical protein
MATTAGTTSNILKESSNTASALHFEAFDLPASNQRTLGSPHTPGTVTPLALKPVADRDVDLDTVVETIKSLQEQGGILTQKLAQHGTLLFRGLPIYDAHDFSKFVCDVELTCILAVCSFYKKWLRSKIDSAH